MVPRNPAGKPSMPRSRSKAMPVIATSPVAASGRASGALASMAKLPPPAVPRTPFTVTQSWVAVMRPPLPWMRRPRTFTSYEVRRASP